jgi:thiol-disulfide isomerase/thioredoxin
MKQSYWVIVVALILVIGLLAVLTYVIRDRAEREAANEADDTLFAEGLENPYTDQSGNPVTLDDYLGSIIVVNSWASWSPFSVQELQDLNQIAGEYKDKNVVVIAVNRKESKEQAERFLSTLPPLPNLTIIIDTKDHFYGAVGGYAMPETVYYDTRGTISTQRQGAVTVQDTRQILNDIIGPPRD